MRFGYTILYVPDVAATLQHYEAAFGCTTRMLHESGLYGELETGDTILAFAGLAMAEMNNAAIQPPDPKSAAPAFEVVFVTDAVQQAYDHAIAHGASPVTPPEVKPWQQTVAYVRDMNGFLVEICSPLLPQHGA